ncbi:galactosylceramide sulfotransferase [Hemibagrus wyckioides]|uniref:galactosylceramide sulfotransferase n=1 Tax=Hemibagrus wyckioides TaxID=337641 RepID=UPI00266C5328|nr:galactosylceramide sulfotransferase [Hemibagrus wyckioides]XP_058267806.1 galactosylceramide sulfotransferase [Hemibagrus wyckioides]
MNHHLPRSGAHKLMLGFLFTCITMMLYCFSAPTFQANTQSFPVPAPCANKSSIWQKKSSFTTSEVKHCVPKMNLMFLKTHKAASSTVLNILLRYGEKNGLKFALPSGRNDFSYPATFMRVHVKDYRPGACFNIICNHMRFNAPEVEALLPSDTFFFTILRDPALVFESSFHYYKSVVPLTWRIHGEDKLTDFLNDPQVHFDSNGFNSFYLKNLHFFDLGFDNTVEPEDPLVDRAIRAISERFQLIMIAEHFEESLILLKDALCWQMDDLLFFSMNTRRPTSVSQLTPELRTKAREWNGVDWKLYRYFNATLWAKVNAYGRKRMEKEVKKLRQRNSKMAAICISGGMAVEDQDIRDLSMRPWQPVGESSILGYNMRNNIEQQYRELCRKMLTPEIQYLTDLGVNLWMTRLWGWFKTILRL